MKHLKTTQLLMRSLLLLACLFMLYSVQAQSAANYTFTSSSSGSLALDANANPIDMSIGTTQLYGPGVDTYTASLQNFGFTFRFMGAAYTQFSANPDGQVRLGSTVITGHTQSAAANVANIIAVNIDNKTGATGKVHYKVQLGTGGNVLVIEWKDILVNYSAAGTTLSTFQLRLYEATGAIEMVYGQMFNSSASAQTSSIGFSSGVTAGKIGQITNIVTTPAYNTTATSYTTTSFPASSAITNLNSSVNGSRTVYTFMPLAAPATPTSLSYTGVGTTLTTVNWIDNSTTESFFTITRATDAAFTQNVQVSTVASTTLSATGGAYSLSYTNLFPNTTYYYNIQAVSEAYISGNLTGSQSTVAAAIYTWNSANGSWTDPNNWNPTRNTTDIADVLQFNNSGLGTSQTATNVPTQTIGRLIVGNGVTASLQAASAATLTIASDGSTVDELQVEAGATLLNDGSAAALTINYSGTGSTGNISGDVYAKSVSGSVVNVFNFSSGTNSVTTVTSTGKLFEGQYGGTGAPTITGTTTSLLIGGMYVHHFTTLSGTIPTATWQTGSTCLIDGYTTATIGPSGFAQTFSDVTWDCSAQTSNLSLAGVVPTVNGTFKVVSTGSGDLRVATTTSPTFTVNNFTQTGGVFELNAGVAAASTMLSVKGSFLHSGGSFCSSPTGTPILNFNGTAGTQNVSFNDAAPTAALTYRISNGLGINLVGTGLLTTNFAINNGGGVRVSTKANAPITTTLTLLYNATGTTLTYDTTASYTMTDVEFPALNGPANLTINVGTNNVITMPASFVSRALSPTGANGILTMTSGDMDINSNTLTLGTSASFPGTLAYTAGNIRVTTGAFSRYFGTTGLPTTAGAQGGLFPLSFGSFNRNASVYFSSGTALSVGGVLTVSHNAAAGLTPVSITDGAYTIDNISNGSWTISQSGITATGTIALRLTAGNLISSSAVTNLRITQASGITGTHSAGTGTFPNLQASRTGLSLAGLTQTHYIGAATADIGVVANSVASGNWDSPTTWDIGAAPACNNIVYILNGKTVTVNSAGNQSKDITIAAGANLTIASGDLTVGCTLNNTPFTNNGTLNVTGGTLNINGSMLHNTGAVFNQSGGAINVDGNAAGNAANSVASGTSIVQINTNLLGWTGGVLTIVDPHANSTASNSFAYNTSSLNADITSGHTLRFGDGVSADAGGNATNGFRMNTWVGSGRITFFNLEVNGGSGTNRFVSTTYTYGVNGNLTINANSEYRDNGVTTYLAGNLSNNGTCTTTGTLYIGTYLGGTAASSTNGQTISGAGVFRNSTTTTTANIASLTIDNSNTTGVTLSVPLSVSGTLTLTKGIVNTSATSVLTLGTSTAAATLSGGSNIAYINGPFARTFASSRTATGTYTVATLFPVGKTAYLPMWVDPTTTAGGAIAITGEAFTTNSGTFGTAVTSLSASRWEAMITNGSANFAGSNIQLGDGVAITSAKKILQASSASGAYSGIKPTTTFTAGTPNTIRTGSQILTADYLGYFAYGDLTPCVAPTNQPTAFTTSLLGGTAFTGSFTAATSNPSNYLVVRYPAAAGVTNPVDYTGYTVGASLGLGKIVSINASTTFNETGLTAATSYDYYVYAYNNSSCFGPIYNTTTPLTATVTTCLSAVSTPTVVAATKATPTGFIALWRQSSTSGVTYEYDLSTTSTFSSFVSGYQSVSTNTDTFAVVTGLLDNTTYYYRVRAVQGGTCYSLNSANTAAKTLCIPTSTAPWTENFDGLTTVGATSFPDCWTKENGDWATTNSTTYTTPKSGSNYLRDAWSATNEYMWTPGFQLTAGTSYDFSFFAQGDGHTVWVLDVFYNSDPNSAGATKIGASYSPSGPGSTAIQPYNKVLRTFTPATSGTYYFALRVNAPSAPWYFAFDDFSLDETPACLEPTALLASSITDVTADISWTASTSASSNGYEYYMSTTNIAPTAATVATGTGLTGTSYSLTGLTANTTYYIWMRSDCGSGNVSVWTTTPVTFTTACTPVSTLPYIENFNSVTTPNLPSCTKREDLNNDGDYWATVTAPTTPVGYTGKSLMYNWNGTNAANDWFYSAGINLTAGVSYRLKFNYGNTSTTYTEKLKVMYGTSPSSTSMLTLVFDNPSVSGGTFRSAQVDFTPTTTGVYYLGFMAYSVANQLNLYLDDISLDVSPSCLEPTALAISAITDATADISWTASTSTPSNGYEYFISTNNIAPTASTAATGTGLTGTSYSLAGLTANATYYLWMRSDCGSGDISPWTSTPVTFTTLCTPLTGLPYAENFDAAITPNLPSCTGKENLNNDAGIWSTVTAPATPVGYSGKTLRYNNSSNIANDWFFTAGVPLTAGVSYRLKFNYGNNSTTLVEKLKVLYGTTPSSASMLTMIFDNATVNANTFRSAQVDFTPTTTGVYYLGFLAYSAASQSYLYIDDISLDETPACLEPTALLASSITDITTDISWTAPSVIPSNGYEYYISTTNTAPTASTVATGTSLTGTSYSLVGLTANTTYYVWMRSDCGSGDFSLWTTTPLTFTTVCPPLTTLPYVENFNSVTTPNLPSCTRKENLNNDAGIWSTVTAPTTPVGYTGKSLMYNYNTTNAANDWFYTTGITLTAGVSYRLKFNYGNTSTTYTEKLKVMYGTFPNSTSMSTLIFNNPSISGGTFRSAQVDFTPTTTGVYYLGFMAYSAANQLNLYLDDISLDVTPTCLEPTALLVSAITDITANISWTAPSVVPSNGYEYYISTINTAPTAATVATGTGLTGTSYSLTGLTANTTYYLWMRSDCGSGDISVWTSAITFKTFCTPISTLPWTENFDGLTTVGATSFPDCWTKENGDWATTNSTTYTTPKSGSNYLRDAWSATNEYMWTPGFQLTAGTSYDFSFFAQGDGHTVWVLDVFYNTVSNSAGATKIGASYSPSGPGSTAIQPYNKVLRRFTAPTSGTYYFALRVNAPSAPWYFAFDDFSLDVSPSCLEPTALLASSITDVTADISWTASTSVPSNGYEYYMSATNTAPTAATVATGTGLTGTSYSLTGLTANTTYYIWMRSDCGSGNVSVWTATPVIFTTLCTPLTTLPYTENFNSVTIPNIPSCTRKENLNNDAGIWSTVTAPTTPVGYTGKSLMYNWNGTNAANDWFYTTGLTLTAGVSYRLTFNYGNTSTTYTEKLKVMYGTSPSSTSMLTLVFDNPSISGGTFRSAQVDFTPTTTGVYYLGFLAYSAANQLNLYLDDISLYETPACLEPAALVASAITETTADISWTAPSVVPSNGYEYYISTTNTAPTAATVATGTGLTGTSYSLTGLTSGTNYYLWMRGDCGSGNFSIWTTTPVTFRTKFIINSLPYTQDFEGTGVNGWSSSVVGGTANDWVVGTPTKTYLNAAHGGSNVWATKLTGTYSPNHNAALVSPNFDFSTLTEDPILRFYHSFYTENNYDGGVLEISVNGGAWKRLDSTLGTGTTVSTPNSYAWYNNNSTTLTAGRPAWSGQSSVVFASATTGWQQSAVKLTGAAGKNDVKFRFRFVSDGTSNNEGWAIDDIEVVEITTPSVAASSVVISNITNTTSDVAWVNGNGTARLVVARLSTTPAVAPTDGKNYRANTVLKAADSTGLGNYVVYKGTGSSVTVSNLAKLTDYTYDVYEYNGRYMHVKFTFAASNNATTLPVTLASFTASAQANDVVVEWNTVSEINNKGFEVERSVDGKVYEKIGFVKGAGNSNSSLNYLLTDVNAFDKTNSAVLYYRLKQIDFNERFTYSNTVSVSNTKLESTHVSVYPNPFNTHFAVSILAKEKGMAEMEIVDMQGKVIATKWVSCQRGANSVEVDELTNAYHGVYFVKLSLNGETVVTRLVKID